MPAHDRIRYHERLGIIRVAAPKNRMPSRRIEGFNGTQKPDDGDGNGMNGKNEGLRLTVLGSRGSIPVSDGQMMLFGGNTSCYQVDAGGETLLLDAGTGLTRAAPADGPVHLLFSHCHADHVLGLMMFPALFQPGREVHLYGRSRAGLSLEQQLRRQISPPLWPVGLEGYPARVICHELEFPLRIGGFTAEGLETRHPGGSLVLKISAGGKSLVYATDFTHIHGEAERLIAFSRDTDLLLYDAQYTPEEFAGRPGFGHSTAETGLEVQRRSGAKKLLLIHHDPHHTDEMLLAREKALAVQFAREGEVVAL